LSFSFSKLFSILFIDSSSIYVFIEDSISLSSEFGIWENNIFNNFIDFSFVFWVSKAKLNFKNCIKIDLLIISIKLLFSIIKLKISIISELFLSNKSGFNKEQYNL
jgi:hypothetical protein